jgi:hypothetical protein
MQTIGQKWAESTIPRLAARQHRSRTPNRIGPPGRVAQWESARFTRERSLVRTQPRPSREALQIAGLSSFKARSWHVGDTSPARAEEAGVPWAGFHTVRLTCASRLFAEGTSRSRCSVGSAPLPRVRAGDLRSPAERRSRRPAARADALLGSSRVAARSRTSGPSINGGVGPWEGRREPDGLPY